MRKENAIGFIRDIRLTPATLLSGLICLAALNGFAAGAPVAASKATKSSLAQEVTFDAELQPYQEIALHAKVSGYLKKMHVDVGDIVKAGDVIATLEVPELENDREHALATERRAKAEIQRYEAEVQRATATHAEAKISNSRLVSANKSQPNLIAMQDLDVAKAREQTAEATLNGAKAALAAAKQHAEAAQSEVKRIGIMLNYARVTAPFAGVITRRQADEGALIQAGTSSSAMPLARLSKNDKLRLVFPVSLSFVSLVKPGDDVEIHLPSQSKSLTAKVSRITQRVETSTRTMLAEVDLENPNLLLIPGVYAKVSLKLNRKDSALVVPVESVLREEKGASIYVITPANTLEERHVTIGSQTPTQLEILSGLKEGELVMLGSRSQLRPGQSVEPKLVDNKLN